MMIWFKRLLFERVSTKLTAMVLLLVLLSATFISTAYFGSSVSIIGSQVRTSAEQGAKQTADYLSLMLTVGTDMGQQIFRNSRLQDALLREQRGKLSVDDKFGVLESVGETLNNTIYSSSFVRSIYILKEQGESWGSGLFNASKVKRYTLSNHQWYSDVVGGRVNELWLPLGYDPFSGGGDNTELVVSLVDAFRNLQTKSTEGVILVNLDGQLILDAVQRIKLGRTGQWSVVDGAGTVIIDPDPARWGKPLEQSSLADRVLGQGEEMLEFQTTVNGRNVYVVSVRMSNGWKLIGSVPVSEIIGGIQSLQLKITRYTALFLVAALLIGLLFSMRITRPLKELTRQMREIERNNFKARSRVSSRDEIGRLSLRFNQMAGQIETLIREVGEAGDKKREAEIRALRHQINPHFLYNTLTSIRWMIKLGNQDGAYRGIAALVELMQASSGRDGIYSTIGQELELLNKYMEIQQFRYGTGLRLEADIDDTLREFPVPRMLLQPIVENAIFHGIAPKDGAGTITLRIGRLEEQPSRICIMVADDGAGMPPGRAASLLSEEDGKRAGMFGIGLKHVNETLQLHYGPGSGVAIRSVPGAGTTVTLILAPKESDG